MSRSIRKETTSLALQVNEVGGNEADDHYWRLASFRCSQLRKRSEGQADSSRARSIPTAWSGARAHYPRFGKRAVQSPPRGKRKQPGGTPMATTATYGTLSASKHSANLRKAVIPQQSARRSNGMTFSS